MRILFIYTGMESLGIEYLSSILKKNGHEVMLLYDPLLFRSFRIHIPFLDSDTSRSIAYQAISKRADLICFSIESDYFEWASRIAGAIKKYKDVPIIFGGIHVSSMPERVLAEKAVDYICVGEGEEAIVELVDRLVQGEKGHDVLNIWSKDGTRIIRNPIRNLRQNLDELPFPDKDLFYQQFPGFVNEVYTIITGRGCCNKCTYCCNSLLQRLYAKKGNYLRRRSIQNVISELQYAKERYHFKRVTFCDDIFTIDINWLRRFIKLYRATIRCPFYCAVHPSFIDEEKIQLLVEGGCSVVNIGIQTLNEDLRKQYLHRYSSNKEIIKYLELFRKTKIFLFSNFIFGLPHQNTEELKKIVLFCSTHKTDFHDVNWLRYYPGTEIVTIAQKEGILTQNTVDQINNAKEFRPYAYGGHSFTKERSRLRNLVFLSHFLPQSITRLILQYNLYHCIPSINMRNVFVFFRLLYMKYLRKKRYPYPNFSIGGIRKYYLHFLIFRNLTRQKKKLNCIVRMLRKTSRKIIQILFLRRLINKKSFLRYCAYFIKRYIFRKNIPGTAIIALTFRCQCHCECCSAGIFKTYFQGIKEMSFDMIKERIERIAQLGIPRIHLTGGEPLLRNDIVDIVRECAGKGLVVFLETNGMLLVEELIIRLKKAGISSINVSLDSSDAQTHNRLRGVRGCYDLAFNAIQFCVKNRVNCIISTYARKENIYNGGLSRLIQLAKKLKCLGIRIIAPQPSGNWIERDDVILSNEDCQKIEEMMPVTFLAFNRTGLIKCPMKSGYKLFILPDGNVAPCEHLPFIFRDSKDMDFSQLTKKINSIEMFFEEYYCLPRDERFRKRYLNKANSELNYPLFIGGSRENMIKLIEVNSSLEKTLAEKRELYCYSPLWIKLYSEVFKYTVKRYYIQCIDNVMGEFSYILVNSRIFGNRIISMPFSDEGGIFLWNDVHVREDVQRDIVDRIVNLLDLEAKENNVDYVEVRGWSPVMSGEKIAEKFITKVPYTKFVLDTSRNYENIRKNYNSNIIKNLRKANKYIYVSESTCMREIQDAYRIYLVQMKKFGSPPLPIEYFIELNKNKFAKIFLSKIKGEIIGFLIVFIYGDKMYADINASLPMYNTFFPKVKLFDESIKVACASGIRIYDFMRTRKNSGVYWHKKKWGGDEKPIYYYYRTYKKRVNLVIDPAQKRYYVPRAILKYMPLFALKKIGPIIRANAGK